MKDNKICRITVDLTEDRYCWPITQYLDTAAKLTERALASGLNLNDFMAHLIENEVTERIDTLESSIKELESLVWRNIYWSALPFIEGPKQRLNAQGLVHYWDRSGNFFQNLGKNGHHGNT